MVFPCRPISSRTLANKTRREHLLAVGYTVRRYIPNPGSLRVERNVVQGSGEDRIHIELKDHRIPV